MPLKVKVYLAEQIAEHKVYWCFIKKKLLKPTQKSGIDKSISNMRSKDLYIHLYIHTHT